MADKLNTDFIVIYNKNKDELLDMKEIVDQTIGQVNNKCLYFRLFSSLESLITFVWLECENCPYMILNDPADDPHEEKILLEYLVRKYGMTHIVYLRKKWQEKQEGHVINYKNGRRQPLTIFHKGELTKFLHNEKEHMVNWFQFVQQTNQLDMEDRRNEKLADN